MGKKVNPGDQVEISANVYNFAVDQFERATGQRPKSAAIKSRVNDTRIQVYNAASDLPRFSIVSFTTPLVVPPALTDGETEDGTNGDYESDFFENPVLQTVAVGSGQQYQWGITQEAIPSGEIGDCLISGVTPVLINLSVGNTSYQFAQPNGTSQSLDPASCGMCRVLWFGRSAGDGLQWCLVNLG